LENQKLQFVYIYKPVKDNFNETATEEENKIISEHFLYLKNLLEKKILILAGPEINAKFGIAVLEVYSEEEAEKIMNNDPAVANKVFTAELFPFRVSLLRNQN
jgi:uncharacterized protein YciI